MLVPIVIYKQKFKGKIFERISPEKADRIKYALSHTESLSRVQKQYIDNVRGVYKGRSQWAKDGPDGTEQTNIYDERYR